MYVHVYVHFRVKCYKVEYILILSSYVLVILQLMYFEINFDR